MTNVLPDSSQKRIKSNNAKNAEEDESNDPDVLENEQAPVLQVLHMVIFLVIDYVVFICI